MNRTIILLLATALLAGCTDPATPPDAGPSGEDATPPDGGSPEGPRDPGAPPPNDPAPGTIVAVDCREAVFSMDAESSAAESHLPDGYSFPAGSPTVVVYAVALHCGSASQGNRTTVDDFQFAFLYSFLADEEGDQDENNVFLYEATTSWPMMVEAAGGLPVTLGSVVVGDDAVAVEGAGTYTFLTPPMPPDHVEGGLFAVSMHAGAALQMDLRITTATSSRLPLAAAGQFDGGVLGELFPAGAAALYGVAESSVRIDLVPTFDT